MKTTLVKVSPKRYHVLKPTTEVTESQWSTFGKGSGRGLNPRVLGSVDREEFTSYPRGKPVQRILWLARTRANASVGGYKTRDAAIQALVEDRQPSRRAWNQYRKKVAA